MKIYNSISFWVLPNPINKQFLYFLQEPLFSEFTSDYEHSTYNQMNEFYNLGNYSNVPPNTIVPINDAQIEFLKSIYKNKLVILHEAPSHIQKLLDKIGVSYIVIYYSPARFMIKHDKIHLLAVKSNIKAINSILEEYRFDEKIKYQYILNRYPINFSSSLIPNAGKPNALLVGQTSCDMSLYNSKLDKFMTFNDYEKELIELDKIYSIIYTKHPLDETNHNHEIIQKLGIEQSEEKTYKLLCNHNIQHVVSISSSILHEARFFFKFSMQYLYQNYVDIEKDYIEIDRKYICDKDFWHMLISATSTKKQSTSVNKIDYNKLYYETNHPEMPPSKKYLFMKCGFEISYYSKVSYSKKVPNLRNNRKYFKCHYIVIFNQKIRIYKKYIIDI